MKNLISALSIIIIVLISKIEHTDAKSSTQNLNLRQILNDLNSSPQIKKANSMAFEYEWKKTEAYGNLLPSLSLTSTRILDYKYLLTDITFAGSPTASSIPQIVPNTIFSLNANWNLFDGFSNWNRVSAASDFDKAAQSDARWTLFSTQKEVTLLYYKSIASRILRTVAEQNEKALADHLRDMHLLKKSGLSTNFDLLRSEYQMSEAHSEVLNSQDNEKISLLRLSDATGADYSNMEAPDELPATNESDISTTKPEIMQREDLNSLQLKLEGFNKSYNASRGHWLPKISLFGQWQKYDNLGTAIDFNSNEFRDARLIGVNLYWNFFDGFTDIARDHQAFEKKVQIEQQLIQAQKKSETDFQFWKRKFSYFQSLVKSRKNEIEKSTESVRLAKEGRKVGARTNTDVLDAQAELYRAKAGLINAQIGAIEASVNLELMLGKNIFKFE